jgi:hypothetical protein
VAEAIRSVMLAGKGLLRWPGGEERVQYGISVGFDGSIGGIHIGPSSPGILRRPSRHANIYLYTPEWRRIALNVAANGHLSPDGPIQRSLDGQDWWVDSTPWLPFETPDRFTLSMKAGTVQIFESHATAEEAEVAYHNWADVETAEIRPPFGRPTRLK